jgi:hypothetical protein
MFGIRWLPNHTTQHDHKEEVEEYTRNAQLDHHDQNQPDLNFQRQYLKNESHDHRHGHPGLQKQHPTGSKEEHNDNDEHKHRKLQGDNHHEHNYYQNWRSEAATAMPLFFQHLRWIAPTVITNAHVKTRKTTFQGRWSAMWHWQPNCGMWHWGDGA